jgi:hypothetical protein
MEQREETADANQASATADKSHGKKTLHGEQRKRNQLVRTLSCQRFKKTSNKSAAVCIGELPVDNLKKYFDYVVFNIVAYALPRSGARRRALAQTIGNARGLGINSPLNAETHAQDLRFHQHRQRDDLNRARGLDNNFASDRDCDSTITTRLHHRRLRRADHAAPDKS